MNIELHYERFVIKTGKIFSTSVIYKNGWKNKKDFIGNIPKSKRITITDSGYSEVSICGKIKTICKAR